MNSLGQSFLIQQFLRVVVGVILCFIGFWPIPGLTHPAGDLYNNAIQAIQAKNLQQAESLLQQAITEFPAYAEAHHLLGIVQYQRTQNANTAIPALKQAITLNPNFAQAHYDLGLLLLNQKTHRRGATKHPASPHHLPWLLGSSIDPSQNA